MKKTINTILVILLSIIANGQQKTKITGYINDLKDSTSVVKLQICYPYDPNKDNLQLIQEVDIVTHNGTFELSIDIDKPVSFQGRVNKKWLLLPGAFGTFLFPGDSIYMDIQDSKSPNKYFPNSGGIGLTGINFSGKGSERINLHKSIVKKINLEPPFYQIYQKKGTRTLLERFVTIDKKLDKVDSMCSNYKGSISTYEKDMVKAQIYDSQLDMITLAGMQQKNDSIPYLFDKYIFKKNRLAPFYKDNIIFYYGGSVVGYSLIIKDLGAPYKFGGDNYRSQKPIEYLNILVRQLKDQPQTRNYLLTQAVRNIFGSEVNGNNAEKAMQIYMENVTTDYILYNNIMELYTNSIDKLKRGKPFFPFELPDTKGKTHKLSDYKGKLLVLDLYFTGCGGCKAMTPFIEQAENELKELPIQFISVSIDRTEDAWHEGIGVYCSKNSIPLYTEGLAQRHPLVKFLRVVGYPALVVIDKNGNIIGTPPNPILNKNEFISYLKDKI